MKSKLYQQLKQYQTGTVFNPPALNNQNSNYIWNSNPAGISTNNQDILPQQPTQYQQSEANNFQQATNKIPNMKGLDMVAPGLGTALEVAKLVNGKKKELMMAGISGLSGLSNRYAEKTQRLDNQYKAKTDYSQYIPTYRDAYDYNTMNEGIYEGGGEMEYKYEIPAKKKPKDTNTYTWQTEHQKEEVNTEEELDEDDLLFDVPDEIKTSLRTKKENKEYRNNNYSQLDVNDSGVNNLTPSHYLNKFNNYQGSVKDKIGHVESNGNYKATNPNSSAYGKYQFLKSWNPQSQSLFNKNINELNENEQEDFMDYVIEKDYKPKANRLKSKLNMSEDDIIALLHFRGEGYVNNLVKINN